VALEQSQIDVARQSVRQAADAMSRLHWPDDTPAPLRDASQQVSRSLARIASQPRDGNWSQTQTRDELTAAYSLAAQLASHMQIVSREITRQTQQQIHQLLLHLALLGGAIVLVAIALSIWQHRSVMRPLSQLTSGVRRLEAGRFDQRINEAGPAELAALARDFNRMADRLQQFYENLEQQVRDKSRQLAQAERLASVGYLAAGVAHEINNPLGIIAAHAELALRKTSGGDPTAPALRIVVEEAFRCKQITQRLLSLSRGSQEREPVSLVALAEQTAAMVRQLPRAAGKTVTVQSADPLNVNADASELKQVLLNLLFNALDACPASGGRVTIIGRLDGKIAELQVIDNGRGMIAATLAKAFEPFYSEKRGVGVGLGLSISHAIITEHGGELTAHSEGENHGATFTLRLPANCG
jgi:signal transduction histidine kinase